MTRTKKPTHKPSQPFPPATDELHREGNWLWIPLLKEWHDITHKPEEVVRQKFIPTLIEHYDYSLEQMDQERRTQHGHKSPRADNVSWLSVADKTANKGLAFEKFLGTTFRGELRQFFTPVSLVSLIAIVIKHVVDMVEQSARMVELRRENPIEMHGDIRL